jgi:hypothetical protein
MFGAPSPGKKSRSYSSEKYIKLGGRYNEKVNEEKRGKPVKQITRLHTHLKIVTIGSHKITNDPGFSHFFRRPRRSPWVQR